MYIILSQQLLLIGLELYYVSYKKDSSLIIVTNMDMLDNAMWHDAAGFVRPLHTLSIIFHISVPQVLFFGYIFIFYDTAIIIEAVVFCSNNIYKKTLILQHPPPPEPFAVYQTEAIFSQVVVELFSKHLNG